MWLVYVQCTCYKHVMLHSYWPVLWIAMIIGVKHSAHDMFLSFVWLTLLGDQIVSVNGQPVMGKSYSQVIELILSR